AVDIASDGAMPEIGRRIAARWEAPSIVVNNAAISPKHGGKAAGVLDVTMDEWLRVYQVNVTAAMLLARQCIPHMRSLQWGRIINVSSRAARSHVNNAGPAYVTSKAALLGLTRSIACDFAADGITCNAVAPGVVASALTDQLPPAHFRLIVDRTPLGRPGHAQEIGSTIAFLASEDAGFITGACIDVNGGQSML
ncbi:MAG: SDR family oxidoreductase, partial [Comamonadaceae bacterium]